MVAYAIELNADMIKVGGLFDDDAQAEPPPHRLGWLAGTPYHLHEVDLFIGRNFLVTSHSVPLPVLDRVWNRWLAQPVSSEEGIGSATYRVLDSMIDEYFPVLDGIVEEVEELEQRLFTMVHKGAKNDDLRALFRIKRDLLQLRRVLGPARDAVLVLSRGDMQLFDRKVGFYFQDVYDHIARLTDSLDVYQDMLTNALESYLSLVSNNLNEVMKALTSVTVMFMAPTLIELGGLEGLAHLREEVFGPVLTMQTFGTDAEGLAMANGTEFGLAACVVSGNRSRAEAFCKDLVAGTIWVNCFFVRDLAAPFGGSRKSGIGREGGLWSFDFYADVKNTVYAPNGWKD